MVTVFYYIYYNVAGVIVTKGAGSLGGGAWRRRHRGLLGISLFGGTGLLWISLLSAKNIRFKTLHFIKNQIPRVGHYVSKIKLVENISFKTAEGKNGRRNLTPYFWTFFVRPKMSILPFVRGSFENANQKHPKTGL